MPRTKNINVTLTAPDLPPSGTRVEIVVQPDGTWVATVTALLPGGTTVMRAVSFADFAANPTKQNRVTVATENLYDAAMIAMGYT